MDHFIIIKKHNDEIGFSVKYKGYFRIFPKIFKLLTSTSIIKNNFLNSNILSYNLSSNTTIKFFSKNWFKIQNFVK